MNSEFFEKTSRQLMGTPAMYAEFYGQRRGVHSHAQLGKRTKISKFGIDQVSPK
jgi:hypothetical protein